MSKSVSRRIARHGVSKRKTPRKRELTAEGLAAASGLDLYHARIAIRGTTISRSQLEAVRHAQAQANLTRLVGPPVVTEAA